MGKNYYKILGIEKAATIQEVKRGYAILVRKYPPEKFADEFNEIREAYEVLSNEESRSEYDEENGFNDMAQQLFDTAMTNLNEENYELVIKDLKKFIMLEPNVNSAKNYLFVAYYRMDKYEEAYKIGKEVIESNIDLKEVYFTNFYDVCIQLKRYQEAESCINNALKIFDTYEINLKLLHLYTRRDYENEEVGKSVLKYSIDPMVNGQDNTYGQYKDLAYYAGLLNEVELESKYLNYIIGIVDREHFQIVLKDIMFYADVWLSGWWFDNALAYVEASSNLGRKLDDGEGAIREFIDVAEYVYNVINELKEIYLEEFVDRYLLEFIINDIRTLISMDDEDDGSLDKEISDEAERLKLEVETVIKTNPQVIVNSINHIKKKYTLVYDEVEKELEEFNLLATNKLKEFESEVEKSKNNYSNRTETTYSQSSTSTSANTSTRSNSSNNSSSGGSKFAAYVLGIIGAIIGGSIGGPVGAFIGAIIGASLV